MKKFRIVTDSFSGYEAQVQYAFFPFKWFQLNHYKGINSWSTPEEAMNFINQKKLGAANSKKMQEAPASIDYQVEFKFFLKTGISSTKNIVWQERFMEYLLQKEAAYLVAGMIMLEA